MAVCSRLANQYTAGARLKSILKANHPRMMTECFCGIPPPLGTGYDELIMALHEPKKHLANAGGACDDAITIRAAGGWEIKVRKIGSGL